MSCCWVRTLRALVYPSRPHVGLLFRVWAVSSARGPTIPSLGCLILTWTRYSESGQPRPRTEQRVNVRNRRPTCETAGSHAGHVEAQVTVAHGQSMTDHGAATHRPAMQHSQERGKHHHLQQRLSRAAQPTSHPASNTICPSSQLVPTN